MTQDTEPLLAGLQVQLDTLRLWERSGDSLAGWKVALTSGSARDLMGPGFRPFGYVLASRTLLSGAALSRHSLSNCHLEPELCFTVGADLHDALPSKQKVRDSLASMEAGFEINEMRRLPRFCPNAVVLADGLSNWGIVVGTGVPVVDTNLATTEVRVLCDGDPVGPQVAGVEMDDPLDSIAALCGTLARFGRGLRAGDRVITGSFSRHTVTAPGVWSAEFAGVGEVQLKVED